MALQRVIFPTGNLFTIAMNYLGDATQWNLIASLNGLVDPFFIGPLELTIPQSNLSGGNGGILVVN